MLNSALQALLVVMCSPPGGSPQQVTESRSNGTLIRVNRTTRSLGFTAQDMEALVFDANEIPGVSARVVRRPPFPAGNHTNIRIDARNTQQAGSLMCTIRRFYIAIEEGATAEVFLGIRINETTMAAERSMNQAELMNSARPQPKSYTGVRVGDQVWQTPKMSHLSFTVGRANCQLSTPQNERLCDALALSTEYKLRDRDDMQAKKQVLPIYAGAKKLGNLNALHYNGNSWAPLGALRAAGVEVDWDKSRYTARCRYGSKTVVLTCLEWGATVNGRRESWNLPNLLVNRQMVIPLQPVATALGMKLNASNGRITLGSATH